MKSVFLIVVFCFVSQVNFAQIRKFEGGFEKSNSPTLGDRRIDSLNGEINVKLSGKTKYTDYKIISHKNDTTIIDTTLTIQKFYKFNFLRKDNFELLAFHNQGETFNNLGYDFIADKQYPDIGFRAKQFNFIDIEDVKYYQVPTPTTEIMYRTGIEQGQVLDALFTTNFSKRFNAAIAYRGLRSLGAYRRSRASTGNFRFSFRYQSPKGQYTIKGHAVNNDFSNQENGGLTPESLEAFLNDDPNFSGNRGRLDVNLTDAESILEGKRLYVEHAFKILSSKDSLQDRDFSNLKVGHIFTRESKYFEFKQGAPTTEFFDSEALSGAVSNKTNYLRYKNEAFIDFNSKYVLGKFRVHSGYTTYDYGYDNLQSNLGNITKNRLRGNGVSFGAQWNGKLGNFRINTAGNITPGSGRLAGNDFYGEAFYKKDSVFTVKAKLRWNTRQPNFNMQLYQSNYTKYNWENNFTSIDTRSIGGEFLSKWGNATVNITNMDNYVYFDEDGLPAQYEGNINYLKVKVSKEFKVGKFALDNTVMYQNVASGSNVFRVPELVTRNTLYYTDNWFKGNPILVQIGATFNYFSKYKANAYNPLLGEFTLQNGTEIGYPTIDLFFNSRVRRTRIYFKADNISSFFLAKDYFSAPTYPYRDFSFRFGVVWDWFI